MSTPREEQILRLADAVRTTSACDAVVIAGRLYDAGARIPDPPAPPAPEVVVSEEARLAFCAYDDTIKYGLARAFPLLLRDNPWAVDQAIRDRVEKKLEQPAGHLWIPRSIHGGGVVLTPRDLLTALGVAP